MFDKQIHRDEFRLRILLTDGCNKDCSFCLNDFQPKPKDKPAFLGFGTADRAIYHYTRFMQGKKLKPVVTFSGGEPGTYPYLEGLVVNASRYGAITKVVTNGLAIHDELKYWVDCWHVGVTEFNEDIVKKLSNVRDCVVQYVVSDDTHHSDILGLVNAYALRDIRTKLFVDFFSKNKEKIMAKIASSSWMAIRSPLTRFTGIQENRGQACKDCSKECVTLKALWVFPDGSTSTCPQGVKPRIYPNNWYYEIRRAFEAHEVN